MPLHVTKIIDKITTMSTQKNSAEKIIHRFGGQTALAHLIGKRQSTVQHWAKTDAYRHTGTIPS